MKLTDRLRESADNWELERVTRYQAADRIDQLEAQIRENIVQLDETIPKVEMLEQIEANLCELHNIALAENEKLKAALAVAKDALEESNEEILYYNGRFSIVEKNREALAKINSVLSGESNEVMGVE